MSTTNLNALNERIFYAERMIAFYEGLDKTSDYSKYWTDYKKYLESFKSSNGDVKSIKRDSRFNENNAISDAAQWIKDNYWIDYFYGDGFTTVVEGKKYNGKLIKENDNLKIQVLGKNHIKFNSYDQFMNWYKTQKEYNSTEKMKIELDNITYHSISDVLHSYEEGCKKEMTGYDDQVPFVVNNVKKENRILKAIKEEQEDNSIEQIIVNFFMNNPYPVDSKVHEFADSIGMEHSEMERKIYELVSTFICGGKSNEEVNKDKQYSDDQVMQGIEIEYEHLDKNSPFAKILSKKITKDHLAEFYNYYLPALKDMEYQLKLYKQDYVDTIGKVEESKKQIKESMYDDVDVGDVLINKFKSNDIVEVIDVNINGIKVKDIDNDTDNWFIKKNELNNYRFYESKKDFKEGNVVNLIWEQTDNGDLISQYNNISYLIYKINNYTWVLQINGDNKIKGSLSVCKASAVDFANKKFESKKDFKEEIGYENMAKMIVNKIRKSKISYDEVERFIDDYQNPFKAFGIDSYIDMVIDELKNEYNVIVESKKQTGKLVKEEENKEVEDEKEKIKQLRDKIKTMRDDKTKDTDEEKQKQKEDIKKLEDEIFDREKKIYDLKNK